MGPFSLSSDDVSAKSEINKLLWGYWWVERRRHMLGGSVTRALMVFSACLFESLLFVGLLYFLLYLAWSGGPARYVTVAALLALVSTSLLSYVRMYRLLSSALRDKRVVRLHYFTPDLFSLKMNEEVNDSVTVLSPGSPNYGVPAFWFNAYKIVVE